MNRLRLVAGLSICALSTLVAACGDDDADTQPGPAATAGSAGSAGGKGGAAGNSGAAGKGGGGAAGKAGSTSVGGSAQGGSAGAAGTAGGGASSGTAGKGGASAGNGGATSAGNGGQSGSAQAGQGGTGQAGQGGKAQAGQGGSAQAGQGGSAQAGQGGSAQAGQGGSAQAGQGGSGQAGQGGSGQGGQGGKAGQGGAAGKSGAAGQGGNGGAFKSSDRHTPRGINTLYPGNGFWEYLPPSYTENGAKSALIVFWHGLGENGDGSVAGVDGNNKPTGLQKVPSNGPPRFIEQDKWPADRPFVVLSPQNKDNCPSANAIRDFTTWAIGHYNVDPKRLYLTGLSCGGIGISSYLAGNVDDTPYAAVVTVSGSLTQAWNTQKCDLGKVALWGLHGDADKNGGTPPAGTKTPMEELIKCASPPRRDARLTMIPGGTHGDDSWDTTYGGTLAGVDIYGWFLDNAKP